MIWGSPWGSGWGNPDRMVDILDVAVAESKVAVSGKFSPAAGWGDSFWAWYLNCGLVDQPYAAGDAETVRRFYPLPAGCLSASMILLRTGHATYNPQRIARLLDGADAKKITITWPWPWEIAPVLASDGTLWGHDSAWSLAGIPYKDLQATDKLTRRRMRIDCAVAAGIATVTLSILGVTVASGSVAVPGTCILAVQGSSGISGSVALDAGTTSTSDGVLELRWPASMRVLIDSVNPPMAIASTVVFNGENQATYTSAAKNAGAWYIQTQPISDTGTPGTLSTPVQSATILAPPDAPTGLHYDSGGAAATVVHWLHAAPAGKTFDVYVQKIGDAFMDMQNPAISVVGLLVATLPAQSGYPGNIRVVVRCSDGGVQEKNGGALEIEYDASGVRVAPRPNSAGIKSITVAAGTVTVVGVYDSRGELGIATKLQLFTRTPGVAYNYVSPDAEAILMGTGLKTAMLVKAGLSDGWRYCVVKAATVAGIQSAGPSTEFSFAVSTAAGPPVTGIAVVVARG